MAGGTYAGVGAAGCRVGASKRSRAEQAAQRRAERWVERCAAKRRAVTQATTVRLARDRLEARG
jgi:hypothetical protein